MKRQLNKTEVVLQQDQSDCAVACLLTIIKFHNGSGTNEAVRRLSGTNAIGTTLLGLFQASQSLGFDALGCVGDIDSLAQEDKPCILHVQLEGKLLHYVVCFGVDGRNPEKNFVIGDPSKGLVFLSRLELDEIWRSKACLILKPNDKFQTVTDKLKAKKIWIKKLIKEDIALLTLASIIGVFVSALGLTMAMFSRYLIDDIFPKRNFAKLNIGIAMIFILLIYKEFLSAIRQYFLLRQSKEFNIRIIDFFYTHLLRLPKLFFDTRKIGDLTARLNDTSRIQRVISQLAGSLVIDSLVSIASIIFIFKYSWQIGCISIIAIPAFYLIIFFHNSKILNAQRAVMNSYAMTEANYISTLQGIEPIKNADKIILFADINKSIFQNYQDNLYLLGKIQIRLSLVANCFVAIFIVVILMFASYKVLNNQLKAGELMAILGMCGSMLPSIANLAMISVPINEAKIAFDRMFEFGIVKKELDEKEGKYLSEINSLQFQQVSFRFAGHQQLLKNISLVLRKGEIIALTGENGSGKSTFSQIIQRFYLHENGQILINEKLLLNELSISSWRNLIGVVPQQIHIFNGTVLENIAFDDAALKPDEVVDFLKKNALFHFFEKLPQSLLTIVGEEGINLSGGQKQLIAIARALYKKPQILILDEATSAMDRQVEQYVVKLLLQLKKDMAIIFITHRLHVLKSFCDKIYLLENGTITAAGNHEELLKSNNLYSRYWCDIIN